MGVGSSLSSLGTMSSAAASTPAVGGLVRAKDVAEYHSGGKGNHPAAAAGRNGDHHLDGHSNPSSAAGANSAVDPSAQLSNSMGSVAIVNQQAAWGDSLADVVKGTAKTTKLKLENRSSSQSPPPQSATGSGKTSL